MEPPHADRRAYLHFGSRFPFPINPTFFGQTFVIGNLTAATRHMEGRRNFVLLRDIGGPLTEPLVQDKARKLASERFNADVRVGYSKERLEEMLALIGKMADEGFHSVLVFHFPVSPDCEYAYALRRGLEQAGLDRHSSIFFYLHTNADSLYHRPEEEMFSLYHRDMVKAADGVIGVSQAVRDNFVKLKVPDGEREIGLDPEKAFVVRNGIDPHIYVVRDEKEVAEARRELGLADGLEKVVSFVGRMDRLKGSDYLIKVLEHFEAAASEASKKVGFVIATSHLLNIAQSSKPFKGLLRMQRLISEDRLKVVLDISKFTRGDPRFRSDVEGLLGDFANTRGLGAALEDPLFRRLYGGMTNIPVQTISDIYLHPSRSEAFGLAILEAVFGGAYVISTNVGGIPEIVVDSRMGRLVDLDTDKNVFVAKLLSALYEAEKPKAYDRKGLEGYFGSYSDISMFRKFEKAVEEGRRE